MIEARVLLGALAALALMTSCTASGPSARQSGSPSPVPTSVPATSAASTAPTAGQSSSSVAPRTGFAASSVYFRDERNGYAIGNVPCTKAPGFCATLMGSTDGGVIWKRMTVPAGLTSVDDEGERGGFGSCGSNGGIAGPCVDRVVFADGLHGYLYSHNFFYSTDDGGRTWRNPKAMVLGMAVVQSHVVRVRATGGCSTCLARLEVTSPGSHNWHDVSPGGNDLFVPHLVASGGAVYVSASTAPATGKATSVQYRSTDGGLSWQPLSATCTVQAAAPDGTGVALCVQGNAISLRLIAVRTTTFGAAHATPAGSNDMVIMVARTASDLQLIDTGETSVTTYESTDGGGTWTRVANVAPWTPIDALTGYRLGADNEAGTQLQTTISVTHDGGHTFATYTF